MLKYTLYGDGIHDDTDAIQELIDSGVCQVDLPVPKKNYLISKPLVIPSNFKLKLPRYATIKLADGSNCFMLQNKMVFKPAKRLREDLNEGERFLWYYGDKFSFDAEDACHDFEVEGGIWDFNNLNQEPNPIYTKKYDERFYLGHPMLFCNVKNFKLCNMTIKDPANFAITIDTGSYFTIENITFDFNFGNPIAGNMDGVHLNGNCHYGVIRNLKGACYDNLIALNAHEGLGGDITNIEIDGIFAEGCHSALRLLTVKHKIQHVTVSNVFGTYYQYGIAITKYYDGETTGYFDGITLNNIYASKAKRLPAQEVHMGNKNYIQFPLVWIQSGTVVKNLSIDNLHRRENVNPIDTVRVDSGAVVDRIIIRNLTLENYTDGKCSKFHNCGEINNLYIEGLDSSEIDNDGVIKNLNIK